MTPVIEQYAHLSRVSNRIGRPILSFCRNRLEVGTPTFHMEALLAYVTEHSSVAPDSPGRILRQLRKDGAVSYEVLSRKDSLYQITSVKGVTP